jgi:hypothetical protein
VSETIAQFYARCAVDGRAVLVGVQDDPLIWIAEGQAWALRRRYYLLCFRVREGHRKFDGHESMEAVKAYMTLRY